MMETIGPATALSFKSVPEIIKESEDFEILQEQEVADREQMFKRSLAGHIISVYHVNETAKTTSGIEDDILESLQAFNGEYSPKDRVMIAEEGGSSIFMNITATKCRAAKSWISDILLPSKGKAWTIEPTPNPDLPQDISQKIEAALKKEFVTKQVTREVPQDVASAQENIREINETQRNVKDAIRQEIMKEAKFQMQVMERQIEDQLVEGKWNKALLTFIDDFVVYPAAFMKGPVVSKGAKMVWKDGTAVVEEAIIFKNKRIDPLDIYPSPSATDMNDGDLIEHLRMSRKELSDLRELSAAGYHKEAIDRVLTGSEDQATGAWWFSTSIESDKAHQEQRGNEYEMNRGVYHGMHFHGAISAKILKSWEFDCPGFDPDTDDNDMIEVEAILVGNEVIKCVVNTDPLLRRPYFKASFMPKPGSFWGRSLPELMKDIQRMCNATARALANNLGIASGPQIEVYLDRLASDDEVLEEMRPRQIWQAKSDPAGNSGRAMQWFQPSSNAAELLKVYSEFEQRADDVTGIPRYAYGNERMTGAAATLGGLSMLLESASKIIKDAIRNIDEGLIKPRVEQQFYMNMLANPNQFTGDVTVTPIGSAVLAIKAFEAMRMNEFLAATANQYDQETMGREGRADVLRVVAKNLGMAESPIPTSFEIKRNSEKAAQAAQQANQQALEEAEKDRNSSFRATDRQISGQEGMAATNAQLKAADLQRRKDKDFSDSQIKIMEIQSKDQQQSKEIAVKIREGSGI